MGNITRDKLVFLKDRPVTGDDSGVIEVNHENLVHGDVYYYGINAYDRYGNRSQMSTIESITAGDVTPPGPITNTASLGGYKSIEYSWTNPSDPDFDKVRIYSDAGLTTMIDQMGGLKPSDNVSKTYMTENDDESKQIYITTLDRNGNENTSYEAINGTSDATPGGGDDDLEDGIAISIVDALDHEWQGEAFLTENAPRAPYVLHIQTTTAITADHIYIYDSAGALRWNISTLTNQVDVSGYKRYTSNSIQPNSSWGEGKGYLDVKVSDPSGSPLMEQMTVYVDRTIPIVSAFDIDDGNTITNDKAVDIKITHNADISGIVAYYISTATGNTNTAWSSISGDQSSNIIRTSYTLPDVEKTYTLYCWLQDRAGNISSMKTSDNNIELQKLVDTPSGNIEFLDLSNNVIAPNSNGWFNQSVRVRYTAEVQRSGMTISSVYWRDNVNGVGWSAWATVNAGINPASINADFTSDEGIIAFEAYAKNSNDEYGGNDSAILKIDKTSPTMVGGSFWNTDKSRSIDRKTMLYWDADASGSDSGVNPSGLFQTYIYRSSNNSFSSAHTVEAVPIAKEWMIDDDDSLVTGHYYYYWGKFEDAAGNLSAESDDIVLQATYDWEREYRNYVSNGSFERKTGISQNNGPGNYHRAIDWTYGYTSGTVEENNAPIVTNDEKFGRYSAYFILGNSTGRLEQQISIPNFDTAYCFSYYVNEHPTGTWTHDVYLTLYMLKPDGTTSDIYATSIPAVSSWTRKSYCFGRGVSGLTGDSAIPTDVSSIRVRFEQLGVAGQDVLLDGVQWEEGRTATDYVDNQVINTQRINAGFIDSNKVRTRSLDAGLIVAQTITADEIASNAIEANHIKAGEVNSQHITTEGLHVKGGGVSLITVGASSSPTTQEYNVLAQNNLYYHPRGYGSGERWNYVKHIEEGKSKYNISQTPQRNFYDSQGYGFNPKSMVIPVRHLVSDITLSNTLQQITSCYAEGGAGSFILPESFMGQGGNHVRFQPTTINLTDSYDGGGTPVTYGVFTSDSPFIGWVLKVPWAGPEGNYQHIECSIDISATGGAPWTNIANPKHTHRGGSQNAYYKGSRMLSLAINTLTIRFTYTSRITGPSSITIETLEFYNTTGITPSWNTNEDQIGTCQWLAWDGFLGV